MSTEKAPLEQTSPVVASSCRKKKSESATFLEDVKDHIDEFIHASMDEHKSCFKKTIQKVSSKSNSNSDYSFFLFIFSNKALCSFITAVVIWLCFQMFGMSKVVAERNAEPKEVESSLPLRTVVSE